MTSNGTAANKLAVREPAAMEAPITGGEIETIFRLARGLSMSGFFRDARAAEQAFAKLIFGRDLGLSATQAMTDIHIVEGKPEMSANLQAAKVLGSGRYDYTVLEHDERVCAIEFVRLTDGKRLGVSRFTIEDAAKADLSGKSTYKRYPRNMLFNRAMSNGVAWFCPDITNGIRVYAEGEVREALPAAAEPEAVAPVAAGSLDDAVVDALRKGIEIAGLDDETLTMWLVDLGVIDVADPHAALATLDADRAQALDSRLSDLVASRDAAGPPPGAEVVQ